MTRQLSMSPSAVKSRRQRAAAPGRHAERQRLAYAADRPRALDNHRRWQRENPEKVKRINKRSNSRRETLFREAVGDGYTRQEVIERDEWRCQLEGCQHPRGRAINPKAPKKSRWSACVVHVASLADSGDNTSTNVVAAHYACACALGGRAPRDVRQTAAVA
jgi:hypothetical protein